MHSKLQQIIRSLVYKPPQIKYNKYSDLLPMVRCTGGQSFDAFISCLDILPNIIRSNNNIKNNNSDNTMIKDLSSSYVIFVGEFIEAAVHNYKFTAAKHYNYSKILDFMYESTDEFHLIMSQLMIDYILWPFVCMILAQTPNLLYSTDDLDNIKIKLKDENYNIDEFVPSNNSCRTLDYTFKRFNSIIKYMYNIKRPIVDANVDMILLQKDFSMSRLEFRDDDVIKANSNSLSSIMIKIAHSIYSISEIEAYIGYCLALLSKIITNDPDEICGKPPILKMLIDNYYNILD